MILKQYIDNFYGTVYNIGENRWLFRKTQFIGRCASGQAINPKDTIRLLKDLEGK